MSDYTKITDFSTKDALPDGDPEKVVSGTEIDAELDAIAVAVATKANGGLDPGAAEEIGYDNDTSGLTADDVQAALDELASEGITEADVLLSQSQYKLMEWNPRAENDAAVTNGLIVDTITAAQSTTAGDPTSAVRFLRHEHNADSTPSGSINRRGGLTSSNTTATPWYRRMSGSASDGGAYVFQRFSFTAAEAGQRAFVGWAPADNYAAAFAITAVLDDIVNSLGVGKDEGDTNLFILCNDGTGAITKTATGVAFTSLLNKTLELWFVAPAGGTSVTYDLYVVEDATHYTGTLSSNLPATDARLDPQAWVNTGSQTTAVTVALSKISVWSRY